MKMTRQECGRLGALKSNSLLKIKKEKEEIEYNKNPKLCPECGKAISYKKRNNKFCSRSCGATFTNKKVGSRVVGKKIIKCTKCIQNKEISKSSSRTICYDCKPIYLQRQGKIYKEKEQKISYCLSCNKEIPAGGKYCNATCRGNFERDKKFKIIEDTGYFITYKNQDETNMPLAKSYLLSKNGDKCEICGITDWNGKPLMKVLDHIDGNSHNHKVENFRLICSNCDSQLDTYKAKNKKSKREYRKKYYSPAKHKK